MKKIFIIETDKEVEKIDCILYDKNFNHFIGDYKIIQNGKTIKDFAIFNCNQKNKEEK